MIFNSSAFLVFFPLVFFLYWFVFNKYTKWQNILLLIASYIFYGWWDWRFLSLIIISSFVDYFSGLNLARTENPRRRKVFLYASLGANLGLLGFFKYFNFFADSFAQLVNSFGLQVDAITLNVILPVGISFYTFQTLSYTLDIYKKNLQPTENILEFMTFVAFFPQLVAGPIERAKHLLPQFHKSRVFDYSKVSEGAKLILWGFFKKVVIADNLAILVDSVYNHPTDYAGFPMVIATIFFAFQIYCDFSGYSDIAIGTARLLGFDLMTNFNKPYFAKSISEFWKRWHISLSTWFRDYLYISLGGNRVTKWRWYFNLFITFVVSGLWHGANWTFVLWGAIHGLYLIFSIWTIGIRDKLSSLTKLNYYKSTQKIMRVIIVFILTAFGWIFFRANNISDAIYIINHMFSDIADYSNFLKLSLKFRGMGLQFKDILTSFILIIFLLLIEVLDTKGITQKIFNNKPFVKWGFYYFILIIIVFWGTQNVAKNFIYFQF